VSANRHRASYDGVTFNGIYTAVNTDTEGDANLDAAFAESDIRMDWCDPSRLSTQDLRELKQFMEGAEPNEMFEGIRTIHIGGRILGSSYGDLEDKAQALHAALSPTLVRLASTAALVGTYPDEPTGVLPFDFRIDSAAGPVARRFYCRPAVGRPLIIGRREDGLTRKWQAWLIAYDPTMYGQTLNQQSFSSLSGGNNTITNAGNYPVFPQIRVITSGNGNASTTLTNSTTGQSLELDLSASGGETWWMFPKRGELVNSSGVSRFSRRISGFLANLYLLPGANVWTWSPSDVDVTSVRFFWRDAYA
jgi:hypothetical protein